MDRPILTYEGPDITDRRFLAPPFGNKAEFADCVAVEAVRSQLVSVCRGLMHNGGGALSHKVSVGKISVLQ